MKFYLLSFLFSLTTTFCYSQQDSTLTTSEAELFLVSIDELLNLKVAVTGKTETTLRETPGIVSIITRKEIQAIGARDMVDILRTVPGFEFASEPDQAIGLGFRGNYGLEGKILVLLDGQQINETGYGAVSWGNRFNINNIEKVEIIRGPGSAIYGGMAELAVINIITSSGANIDGVRLSTSVGTSENSLSRSQGSFAIGKKINDDLEISLTGNYSNANRSNSTVTYNSYYYINFFFF